MDQLKVGLQFVWTHRFWFSLGLSVILASLLTWIGVGGSTGLAVRFKRAKDSLEQVYSGVAKYASGSNPNRRWVDLATSKEEAVAKEVGTVAELLYKDQAPLFKWPEKVQKQFGGRPFMADLTDNKRQYLVDFLDEEDAYRSEVDKVWRILRPVEKDADGTVYGYVQVPPVGEPGSITYISIPDRISTWEAWMAMEELWVQAAIARAIVKANDQAEKMTEPLGAKKWLAARVRQVNAIAIGKVGLDSQNAGKSGELKSYDPPAAPAGASGGAPAGGTTSAAGRANEPNRYLEKTEEFRSIPVFVSLMIEQSMVAEVLAALNQADFGFTTTQVSFFVPDKKVEIPAILREQGRIGRLSERDDPGFNTYQLDVWGTVRLYEMPKAMKEAWEAKRKEAASGTPAAAPATPAPPTNTPAAPTSAPATPPATNPAPTPPAGDAAKSAPAAPPAPPPAGDAAKAAPSMKPGDAPATKPGDAPTTKPGDAPAAKPAGDTGKAAPPAGDAGKPATPPPSGDAGKPAPPAGEAGKAAPPAGDPKKPGA